MYHDDLRTLTNWRDANTPIRSIPNIFRIDKHNSVILTSQVNYMAMQDNNNNNKNNNNNNEDLNLGVKIDPNARCFNFSINTLVLGNGGKFSVSKDANDKGCILIIDCQHLRIENGGRISVNGAGYRGGDKPCQQGYSFQGIPKESQSGNNGAGGGSKDGCGGGASYGTKGKNGTQDDHTQVLPGACYGDDRLSMLYCGSGGGSGDGEAKGGNGGGGLVIICRTSMTIEQGGLVSANGRYGKNSGWSQGGCGSGGSIYIKTPILINDGNIEVKGGSNENGHAEGDGGYGRIRIDCNNTEKGMGNGKITPKIGFKGEYDD